MIGGDAEASDRASYSFRIVIRASYTVFDASTNSVLGRCPVWRFDDLHGLIPLVSQSIQVETLLNADPAKGRVALVAEVALSEPECEFPLYDRALRHALAEEPPPFDRQGYADLYRQASADPQWMAVSLITNAEREGDGAKRLWSLAACSPDENVQQLLKQHAVDESGHALLYLAMLDLTFPNMVAQSFREELQTLSPRYSMTQPLVAVKDSPYAKEPTIDDYMQMNIAEIRTTIHHTMQRPAIARHCTSDDLPKIGRIQDSLLRDELKHVAYTAELIDRIAHSVHFYRVAGLFTQRFRDFNQITITELGENMFDCSVACCARHPECRSKATVQLNYDAN